jgi:hypothetical protein
MPSAGDTGTLYATATVTTDGSGVTTTTSVVCTSGSFAVGLKCNLCSGTSANAKTCSGGFK